MTNYVTLDDLRRVLDAWSGPPVLAAEPDSTLSAAMEALRKAVEADDENGDGAPMVEQARAVLAAWDAMKGGR